MLPLIALTTLIDGLFAGVGLQKLFVELPARKNLGTIAFAQYSRASDLGNGVYLYSSFAIGGFLLKAFLLVLAWKRSYPGDILVPLGLAVVFGGAVLVTTGFAAPQMLRIRRTADKEELLSPLLEKFVFYSYPRSVFMLLQFVAMLWVLIVGSSSPWTSIPGLLR